MKIVYIWGVVSPVLSSTWRSYYYSGVARGGWYVGYYCKYCIVNSGWAEEQRVRRGAYWSVSRSPSLQWRGLSLARSLFHYNSTVLAHAVICQIRSAAPHRRSMPHIACLLAVIASSFVSAHWACPHQLTPLARSLCNTYITLQTTLHSWQVFIQYYLLTLPNVA